MRINNNIQGLFSTFFLTGTATSVNTFTVSKEPIKLIIKVCYAKQRKINVGNVTTWLAPKQGKWKFSK